MKQCIIITNQKDSYIDPQLLLMRQLVQDAGTEIRTTGKQRAIEDMLRDYEFTIITNNPMWITVNEEVAANSIAVKFGASYKPKDTRNPENDLYDVVFRAADIIPEDSDIVIIVHGTDSNLMLIADTLYLVLRAAKSCDIRGFWFNDLDYTRAFLTKDLIVQIAECDTYEGMRRALRVIGIE